MPSRVSDHSVSSRSGAVANALSRLIAGYLEETDYYRLREPVSFCLPAYTQTGLVATRQRGRWNGRPSPLPAARPRERTRTLFTLFGCA